MTKEASDSFKALADTFSSWSKEAAAREIINRLEDMAYRDLADTFSSIRESTHHTFRVSFLRSLAEEYGKSVQGKIRLALEAAAVVNSQHGLSG